MLSKYFTYILLFSIFFLSSNKSFCQSENNRLNEQELAFIKENYNWEEEEVLLINFKQPIQFCHYDNYANIVNSHKWWDQFYSKMELINVKNIFVYATERRARKIIDLVKYFPDKDSFLLNRFFREEKTCYAVVLIHKNGSYQKFLGEYYQEDIVNLFNALEKE